MVEVWNLHVIDDIDINHCGTVEYLQLIYLLSTFSIVTHQHVGDEMCMIVWYEDDMILIELPVSRSIPPYHEKDCVALFLPKTIQFSQWSRDDVETLHTLVLPSYLPACPSTSMIMSLEP